MGQADDNVTMRACMRQAGPANGIMWCGTVGRGVSVLRWRRRRGADIKGPSEAAASSKNRGDAFLISSVVCLS